LKIVKTNIVFVLTTWFLCKQTQAAKSSNGGLRWWMWISWIQARIEHFLDVLNVRKPILLMGLTLGRLNTKKDMSFELFELGMIFI